MNIVQLEIQRYKQKGKFAFLAILIIVGFLWSIPNIWEPLWKNYVDVQNINYYYVIGISLIHTLSAAGFALFYYPIYKYKIPFFEKFRTNPNAKWPWEQENWKQVKKQTIQTLVLFHFFLLPLFAYIDTKIGIVFRYDNQSFPSIFEVVSQILIAIFFEDMMFFWSHYILHAPFLYKLVHKKHHEYTQPYSLTAEYANPLEYLFGNVIPASFGFKLLRGRAHLFTVFLWVLIRIYVTAEAHSGYEFPFSPMRVLPMSGGGDFHDFHHSKNYGAYGSFFTIWDHIMKTDKEFYKHRSSIYKMRENNKIKIENKKK